MVVLVAFPENKGHFSCFGVCFAQGSKASFGNGLGQASPHTLG